MCGIAGIIRWDGAPVAEGELRAMCGAMTHRGPDDEGVYVNGGVLNPAAVERQLQLHQRGRDLDLQLWTMLSFELWCRRFLDTEAEPV